MLALAAASLPHALCDQCASHPLGASVTTVPGLASETQHPHPPCLRLPRQTQRQHLYLYLLLLLLASSRGHAVTCDGAAGKVARLHLMQKAAVAVARPWLLPAEPGLRCLPESAALMHWCAVGDCSCCDVRRQGRWRRKLQRSGGDEGGTVDAEMQAWVKAWPWQRCPWYYCATDATADCHRHPWSCGGDGVVAAWLGAASWVWGAWQLVADQHAVS